MNAWLKCTYSTLVKRHNPLLSILQHCGEILMSKHTRYHTVQITVLLIGLFRSHIWPNAGDMYVHPWKWRLIHLRISDKIAVVNLIVLCIGNQLFRMSSMKLTYSYIHISYDWNRNLCNYENINHWNCITYPEVYQPLYPRVY